jgi:hypothetical protein
MLVITPHGVLPSSETCLVLKLAYTGVPTRTVANSLAFGTRNSNVWPVAVSMAVAVPVRASTAVTVQQ